MKDGVEISVRLQPAARRAGIEGLRETADGAVALKVSVTEAPEGGKANAALIKMLARAWKVPKGAVHIVSGQKQRNKKLILSGDATTLGPKLRAWVDGLVT